MLNQRSVLKGDENSLQEGNLQIDVSVSVNSSLHITIALMCLCVLTGYTKHVLDRPFAKVVATERTRMGSRKKRKLPEAGVVVSEGTLAGQETA